MSEMFEREGGFEAKYAKDEEKRFKIESHAVRAFGMWAAQQLSLEGLAAEMYAARLVKHNLGEPGIMDVIGKVSEDMAEAKVGQPVATLQARLDDYMRAAEQELAGE